MRRGQFAIASVSRRAFQRLPERGRSLQWHHGVAVLFWHRHRCVADWFGACRTSVGSLCLILTTLLQATVRLRFGCMRKAFGAPYLSAGVTTKSNGPLFTCEIRSVSLSDETSLIE